MARTSRTSQPTQTVGFSPSEIITMFTGLEVPDPITFTLSKAFLNKGSLYPRQATLLKIIFLRDDLFTEYDLEVIKEWDETFKNTGNCGINPGILDRIAWLKANGHKWFKEVVLVLGRRSGKGHISGIAMSYVLWNYMAKGDPQEFYGVDRDKKLTSLIFAGKLKQAIDNVFSDVKACVMSSNCFTKYLVDPQVASFKVMAPHDFVRMRELHKKGLRATPETVATFIIEAKESTTMAGRGSASFMQAYDEMAHVTNNTAKATAEEVFTASTPALDQFGKDSFIVEPSSPWQMMGKFYENYKNSLELNEDNLPVYNKMLMLQLPSWEIYRDWERAHEIPMFPEGFEGDLGEYVGCERQYFKRLKGAIQEYDEEMRLLERSNPETFAVERRSHFATAMDAYLKPNHIADMFLPWKDRDATFGPIHIAQNYAGRPHIEYVAHGDPSKVNDLFGFALAHKEMGPNGRWHVVFDRVHHWDPADFDNHTIDYDQIEDEIFNDFIKPFQPYQVTFDQYNSSQSIMRLTRRTRADKSLYRGPSIRIYEETATAPKNWSKAEVFKTALYMGLIHAPFDEELDLELKFLIKKEGVDRVDHPSAGPVQRKDVADAVIHCVYALIGDQMLTLKEELGALRPMGGAAGGYEPFPGMSRDQDMFSQMGRSVGRRKGYSPSYGGARDPNSRKLGR